MRRQAEETPHLLLVGDLEGVLRPDDATHEQEGELPPNDQDRDDDAADGHRLSAQGAHRDVARPVAAIELPEKDAGEGDERDAVPEELGEGGVATDEGVALVVLQKYQGRGQACKGGGVGQRRVGDGRSVEGSGARRACEKELRKPALPSPSAPISEAVREERQSCSFTKLGAISLTER